jgi:hypothetical protein
MSINVTGIAHLYGSEIHTCLHNHLNFPARCLVATAPGRAFLPAGLPVLIRRNNTEWLATADHKGEIGEVCWYALVASRGSGWR